MSRLRLLAKIAAWLLAVEGSPARAVETPTLKLGKFQHAGSGCAHADRLPHPLLRDGALVLGGMSLHVKKGEKTSLKESRTFCQQTIAVTYPKGWQFQLESVEATVASALTPQSQGQFLLSAYFPGQENQQSASAVVTAAPPTQEVAKAFEGKGLSSCSGEDVLNVKAEIRLPQQSEGVMHLTEPLTIKVRWFPCKQHQI